MQNFVFKNPTEILFGKGTIAEIGSRVPMGVPVMMTYGGGSIKRNGVYDQVKTALKHHTLIEFEGIEPNPTCEKCLEAVEVAKKQNVQFLLSVGGGSVLDATKFIAAAARYQGQDAWDILKTVGNCIQSAMPFGSILTLPATGSESNGNAVISRKATSEKLYFGSIHTFPQFAVLDPETTFSLPAKQVRNGVVDAFVHVLEQYLTYPADAPLQDRFAESILQTLAEVGPKTLAEPQDYQARASFMWGATLALNNLIGCGVPQDWTSHMIGHELTAFYGLDHAETLAVVLFGVWQHRFGQKEAKLRQFGQRVWKVETPQEAIDATEGFFQSLGMPTRLGHYRIDAEEAARRVQARFAERGKLFGEYSDVTPQDAAAMVRLRA